MRSRPYDTSMDVSSGRYRRWTASWLGLLLLFFNLVGGGVLSPPPIRAASAPFAQELLFPDRIVICTAAGMVVLDRGGKPVDENPQHSSHDGFCVFCLPLMHSGAAVPTLDSALVLPPASRVQVTFAEGYRLPVLRVARNSHPARAPPAFI